MNIPTEVVWEIILLIIGFVFGTLWGHHGAIGKRVTYKDCSEKQQNCPCVQQVKAIQDNIKELHPQK